MQDDYTQDIAGRPGACLSVPAPLAAADPVRDMLTGYDSADGTHWARVAAVTLAGFPAHRSQAGLFADLAAVLTARQPGGSSSPARRAARPWPPGGSDHVRLQAAGRAPSGGPPRGAPPRGAASGPACRSGP